MKSFKLDCRLQRDTYAIVEGQDYYVGLHKNALVPWVIVVPKTYHTELCLCDDKQRQHVREVIDELAIFMKTYFEADKINVATLGNVVSQLHIHVIARYQDDFAWPDPVWGKIDNASYSENKKERIIEDIKQLLLAIEGVA